MFGMFSPRDKSKNGSSKNLAAAGKPAGGAPAAKPAEGADGDGPDIGIPEGMPKVSLEDFDLLKVLGKGGFGKVMLVRKKGTTDIYAMKVLKKEAVIRRNQVAHTKTETHILKQIRHPFLTRMYFAFQSEGKLYMVLNYLPGGELFYRLKREGRFSVERVRLYTAEIALGLGHLHSLDMIYRDLKPENILLDEVGHICLTDFGLSKESVSTPNAARTFCGTPEYLAPEIILNKGHGFGADWWCVGILTFECLTSQTPFVSNDPMEGYRKIIKCRVPWPPHLQPMARDFIDHLLTVDPSRRLGTLKNGPKDVKAHPWFTGFDFKKLENKQLPAPYVPKIKSQTDDSNFDHYEDEGKKNYPQENFPRDAFAEFADEWCD